MALNAGAPEQSIRFESVRFSRGEQPILNGITGEWTDRRIGLIGHNGSGKSTFARLCNGLLQPASGQLRVHGRNPASGPEDMAATVGFIFQNPDHQLIFPTVEEELCFGLRNQGHSRHSARTKAQAALADWGMADWRSEPVHSLSEGQKQLVCLLSVLILEPALLILDEPFAALDLSTQRYLDRLLAALPQQVLMITHDLALLRHYDRIIWLADGHIYRDGPPDTVLPEYETASDRIARARSMPESLSRRSVPC